jgi:predicted RND superfamily exporter protein
VAAYAVLLALAAYFVLQVQSDPSIDRLIVASDPDYQDTAAFHKIFPEGQHVILLAEASDPFSPSVLTRVDAIEERLRAIPHVDPVSLISAYRRLKPDFAPTPEHAEALRRFATGTDLFRKQALVGDGFLGVPVALDVAGSEDRDRTLAAIDAALAPFEGNPAPLLRLTKVGGPYVDAYLERETGRASRRYFPLFGAFVVALNLALYRSFRALAAFLLSLAASVALTVGFAGVVGFAFTIVSSLVPLTVMVTCSATLVYIHSRFVDLPEGRSVADHHVFALSNKLVACTASIFAAAVGFAALSVSAIRPIREMGIWVAAGLAITWVVAFTLFPALQRILKTPTRRQRAIAGERFPRLVAAIPLFSYRFRFVLVPAALALSAGGVIAILGAKGFVAPMRLETDALDYIDRDTPIYQATRRLEKAISGLSVTEIWIEAPPGGILEPGVLRGLEELSLGLEGDPRVGSVVGPTTLLRFVRYASGRGDRLPDDPSEWPRLSADLEQLLLQEPSLREFVDVGSLTHAHLTVIDRSLGFADYRGLTDLVRQAWSRAAASNPALAECRMRVVGQGLLQAKIAHFLVPTLVESVAIAAAVIFFSFLLVFRSPAARVLAVIPSLFAILVMFLLMRVLRIPLNVATILIASTVLGASENDQVHFFYHYQEMRRAGGSRDAALRHALLVAGKAIVFATLINAAGFSALALSPLPPMRQFGIISACAFVLSMVADFTVLPAALWIFHRDRPDVLKSARTAESG